jgi:hypothetical protein
VVSVAVVVLATMLPRKAAAEPVSVGEGVDD